MAGFYSARSSIMPPLPWPTFAPPLSSATVRTVIWATGYRDETAWVEIPSAVGPDGTFSHTNGVSPVPGLYFAGRPWQRNRASALVMGAGPDAERIVEEIVRRQHRQGADR